MEPNHQLRFEKQVAIFLCSSEVTPVWKKDGLVLSDSHKPMFQEVANGKHTVKIHDLDSDDTETYTCIGYDPLGLHFTESAELKVGRMYTSIRVVLKCLEVDVHEYNEFLLLKWGRQETLVFIYTMAW